MPVNADSNDYAPLFWYRRNPFYLTAFISLGLVLGMLATSILESANVSALQLLGFWPEGFFQGWYWQLFTYPFIEEPSFFFIFGVLFFFFAGNEVEKYLGRKRFITLLSMLWIVPPVIMCIWKNPWARLDLPPFIWGSSNFTAALIIGYATLYPNLEYMRWVPMKWIAAGCLFLSSLSCLPRRDWSGLLILWGMCGVTFGYIRWLQLGAWLPRGVEKFFAKFKRKPKFRVVRDGDFEAQDALHDSIDPLLDKIAKSGLSSLTAKERARLEQASKTLKKKE